MQRFGINEEQFEYFMTEIYNKCQRLEISPEQIGEYLTETINLSNTVFPSQIPSYIKTKKREIENLKEQIENMQKTRSELNNKKTNLEEDIKSLIEDSNISREAIKWYKDIIKELENKGIPIDDITFFIQCLREIKKDGYDVNKVLTKYSELIYFDKLIPMQEETKQRNVRELENLKELKNSLEEQLNRDRLKLSQIQELENIGFGLKELKTIYNTIREIAKDNNTNPKEAIKKFFYELDEYDDFVNFEKKAENLKNEISNVSMQIANNRITLLSQPHIGTRLQGLLKIGISEKDIADINSILFFGGFDYYNNNDNNMIINKQSLISELNKYRNIKLVIKSLEQKTNTISK